MESKGTGKGGAKETRLTLRIPSDLAKLVKHNAVDRECSVNSAILCLISEALELDHVHSPTSQETH